MCERREVEALTMLLAEERAALNALHEHVPADDAPLRERADHLSHVDHHLACVTRIKHDLHTAAARFKKSPCYAA